MLPNFCTCIRAIAIITTLCLFSFFDAHAQQSIGGTPYSFLYPDIFTPQKNNPIEIAPPDLEQVRAEDARRDRNGKYTRYATWTDVQLNLNNSGTWLTLPNGDRVWRLSITSKQAKAINLLYNDFYLPTDSRLFIYNAAHTHIIGAFSDVNNKESRLFATGNVRGETTILEYYEPAAARGKGVISIEKVGYVYRFVSHPDSRKSEPCQVDANCTEGSNWQNQKRGAVRISVVDGQGAGWCSGSLINNTRQDCKGYILTALHCGQNSNATNFNQYIFYFNYESSGCKVDDASTSQSITGCTKRADSNDGGGETGSDYMLVELNSSIPANYNVYYNGWNAANTPSSSGVSIHHPAGDRKKISTYSAALRSNTWRTVPDTHWEVTWVATANGHGVTEGGSSGSPIFDNAGRIVGQLTGGASYCETPNSSDLYGKMSYNWSSNPNGTPLKNLLDPTNSGVLQLAGSSNPCSGGGSTPTCSDGIQNGNETGIDCGGSCTPCTTAPTCSDGIQNGNETGIDCGGSCTPCTTAPTCSDGIQNGNETGIDCGGSCKPCGTDTNCETFTLTLNLDNYGDETRWEVKKDGAIMESGGPYNNSNVNTITKTMCFTEGCYEFIIYDTAGDGMCCDFGNGNYKLTNSNNEAVVQGGQFQESETANFCANRSAALPLNWLAFTATPLSSSVQLNWQTSAERDNEGFVIERSKDGEVWEEIGWQVAHEEGVRSSSYQFTDTQITNGWSFYRLAQVSTDGQQSRSEIRRVHFDYNDTDIKVYPNPLSTQQLSIVLPNAETLATVLVFDPLGKQLARFSLTNRQNELSLATLPAGVYWLQIQQDQRQWTQKLVKH